MRRSAANNVPGCHHYDDDCDNGDDEDDDGNVKGGIITPYTKLKLKYLTQDNCCYSRLRDETKEKKEKQVMDTADVANQKNNRDGRRHHDEDLQERKKKSGHESPGKKERRKDSGERKSHRKDSQETKKEDLPTKAAETQGDKDLLYPMRARKDNALKNTGIKGANSKLRKPLSHSENKEAEFIQPPDGFEDQPDSGILMRESNERLISYIEKVNYPSSISTTK